MLHMRASLDMPLEQHHTFKFPNEKTAASACRKERQATTGS